jgi:hypothetical protein
MTINPGVAASFRRAALHTLLGDFDAAFVHLERIVMARDPRVAVYLGVHWLWAPLRGDARMIRLLSYMACQRVERASPRSPSRRLRAPRP